MARVPRNVAGAVWFGASVAGADLIYRGLWEVQPLVTFGQVPTPSEVTHGRELLAAASAVTVCAGAIVAAAGARLNGALVALPGPVALLLTYIGPANRGPGWVAVVLSLIAIGAALHTASRSNPGQTSGVDFKRPPGT